MPPKKSSKPKLTSKTSSSKTKPLLSLNKSVSTFSPKISKRQHKGYVYNVTTETGNLFVEDILVHNSGGLGTPPHLRVECLSEDSLVLLGNGDLVKAKELLSFCLINSTERVGDALVHYVSGLSLVGVDGFKIKEAGLYRVIERPFEGDLFKVKTRFGETIEATGNHPLAVFTENGIEYVPVENLSAKDFLVKPRQLNLKESVPVLPSINKAVAGNAVHLSLSKVNEDFCYWLGGMLSEGDFTSFQYSSSNKYLCEAMAACFGRATGFKPDVYQNARGYFFTSFNRKEVSELTASLGLNGKTAKFKEVPSDFMSLPKSFSAQLLAGLFDGDGSIGKDGEISYCSASKKLAFQVKTLLLKFGIQSTLSSRKQSWNSLKEGTLYKVRTLDRSAIEVFFNEIPLKRKGLKENCVSYLSATNYSKTAKRRTIPLLFNLLESSRKKLFMTQDEVLPERQLKNYDKSDVSFEKLGKILVALDNRVNELKYLALESSSADWAKLREIATKLHLGTRKVRKLSGKDFRWGYRANAGTLPYFRSFFSTVCETSQNSVSKEIDFLKKIYLGDAAFDQIVSIEKKFYSGTVYDLTTETGNFVSQNLLVKNCGYIHRASGGVLFLDEIATLSHKSQQELLTAMQEKKYAITGQSENSSGAMTRTEPVPCFPKEVLLDFGDRQERIGDFVDSQINCNKSKVISEGLVEYLDVCGAEVLSYSQGKIVLSKINRVYRRKYSGSLFRIRFDDGSELLATPEHPIKTNTSFVKAQDLLVGEFVESKVPEEIISAQSIVGQYSKENIRIKLAYEKWKANPRLSCRELGVDYKTIKAWINGAMPPALKTVSWLSHLGLLPLSVNDKRLPVIARIAGALFGDGGLDSRRLSRVYFSVAAIAIEDINEFCEDMVSVFGEDLRTAFSIRKTRSKSGAGLELSINKAEIARFFYSLGVLKGDKVSQKLLVPWWIKYSEEAKKEFFSSLISCELYGKLRSSQDVPNFVMAKVKKFEAEHIAFLNELKDFLSENGVETGEIMQDKEYLKIKNLVVPEKCGTYVFDVKSNYKNLIRFSRVIGFPYAKEKRESFFSVLEKGKQFIEEQERISRMKDKSKGLRQKGCTLRDIAKETNIALATVMKTVGPTYNKYSENIKFKVKEMIKFGGKPKTIAKELNIPYTTVLYWKNQGM